jgi:hypothetical protein
MTGHVPETAGHDAENTGHAPPKYAAGKGGGATHWLQACIHALMPRRMNSANPCA